MYMVAKKIFFIKIIAFKLKKNQQKKNYIKKGKGEAVIYFVVFGTFGFFFFIFLIERIG